MVRAALCPVASRELFIKIKEEILFRNLELTQFHKITSDVAGHVTCYRYRQVFTVLRHDSFGVIACP